MCSYQSGTFFCGLIIEICFLLFQFKLKVRMKHLNALALLKDSYPSDDEDCDYNGDEIRSKNQLFQNQPLDKVPELFVPETILNSFTEDFDDFQSNDNHNGRIRSFPHERGNWATCLYVPIKNTESINALCDRLIPFLHTVGDFHRCDDFHISFSKTVVLRHHWIQLFVDGVKNRFEKLPQFTLDFENLEIFLNDERTRTFLTLKVQLGCDKLLQLVKYSDENLLEFKLPVYYENPCFHMSILWCAEDKEKDLRDVLPVLQQQFCELTKQDSQLWSVDVNEVHCKIGNRLHRFKLVL